MLNFCGILRALLQLCIELWRLANWLRLASAVGAGLFPRIGNDKKAAYLMRLTVCQSYFEMQRLALVPPKPKLFVNAFLTVRDCAVFAT
jgi:hypothetical protein